MGKERKALHGESKTSEAVKCFASENTNGDNISEHKLRYGAQQKIKSSSAMFSPTAVTAAEINVG